jgi:uncharacterized protein (DUF58 family)
MSASSKYLPPETAARVRRLELKARRIVEGFLSGQHRSPYFGQSVEFLQHRPYVPGDELRHIDWKVWARQDRLHIKQYEEETNFRLSLLVDASASMAYGAGEQQKFDYAAQLAAALALLVQHQQDAVGLVTFADRVLKQIPASNARHQLLRIMEALQGTTPQDAADLSSLFASVGELLPRRGLVVVISDVLDGGPQPLAGIGRLRAAGQDCILLHVLHADELEFPFNGATRFEGLESSEFLNCNPRALREGYLEALHAFLERTKRGCANLSVDYHLARTDRPAGEVIAAVAAARSRKRT